TGEVIALRTKPLQRKLSATLISDKVLSSLLTGERVFDSRERGFYAKRIRKRVSFAELRRPVAKIQVVILDLGRQVIREGLFVARPDDKTRAGLAHAVCHYRTSEENLMVFVFNGKAALGIEKSALSIVYPMRPARALPSRA